MASSADDRAWFLDQVREHQARLRATIRTLGVRAEAVDDVAQDALVLAWQKLGEFDRAGEFGSWVREIARRLVVNERRKEARRSRILAGEVTDLLLQQAPAAADPLDRLERDEALSALRTCLSALPAGGRDVIRLRYFEHLAPGTIAGHLGKPANAVRQYLLRLRRALSECVEERLAGRSDGCDLVGRGTGEHRE